MKITFVLPFVNLTGGIRVLLDYANWLHDAGHDVTVFDDAENFVAGGLTTPEAALVSFDELPQLTNGATSGWTYLNLDTAADGNATQNWVVVSLSSPLGYSGDFDATALGNGCTPETAASEASVVGGGIIGPAPNEN